MGRRRVCGAASWVSAGRIAATITLAASTLTTPRALVTHSLGAGTAVVSLDASKRVVVSIGGSAWTAPVPLAGSGSDVIDVDVEAGGGSVPTRVRARIQGAATYPWDLAGTLVAAPTQAAVAADTGSPALGSGVSMVATTPAWASIYLPSDLGSIVWGIWDAAFGIATSIGVSSWTDVSGNLRAYTQGAGASQPAYSTSHAAFKGQPALSFDGVNDLLNSGVNDAGTMSFGIVARVNSASTYPLLWCNTFGQNELRLNASTGRPEWLFNSTTVATYGSSVVGSTVVITGGHNGTGGFIAINGGAHTFTAGTPSSVSTVSAIGARTDASLPANMDIAYLVAFTSLLTAPQEAALVSYLSSRFV